MGKCKQNQAYRFRNIYIIANLDILYHKSIPSHWYFRLYAVQQSHHPLLHSNKTSTTTYNLALTVFSAANASS